MENKRTYILLIVAAILALIMGGCSFFKREPIKIACIGDNITYGHGIQNRGQYSYPAQLEHILGDKYDVENYGASGSTILKSGDLPFWVKPEYDRALAFEPDIVIIMLGSNDSKPWNWEHSEHYSKDYITLINEFKDLKSKPEILICNPLPAFSSRWGICDSTIRSAIIPKITAVASSEKVELIDFYEPFSNKADLLLDSIHPDSLGASIIAKQLAIVIQTK